MSLGRRWSRQQHELCRLLAEYDLSGGWAVSGAASCSRWAADALEVESCTAREWLRVGHAMRSLAEVDAAFAQGRLSYAKVRTLTRVAVDHPDRQQELIGLAERSTASSLSWELARWTGREEDDEERDRRHRREMGLAVRTEPDGACVITARLPPLAGAAAIAALDARVMQRSGQRPSAGPGPATEGGVDATVDASSPPSVMDARAVAGHVGLTSESRGAGEASTSAQPDSERQSLAQQRAVALVDMLTGGGRRGGVGSPTDARVDTELVIHLRGDGCTLDDGTPVAGHLVERLAPTAFYRVLIHDAEQRPINASGRQRHPTTRQKRVVAERDGHVCSEPGCTATQFLEYDHVPDFEISGRTVVDELVLRCSKDHRERHRQKHARGATDTG